MAAKKVGTLIKEARTSAGMTQEQLAKKVKGCAAADISKAERGEKELTQDQLKAIAKATGVTQKSLIDAAKGSSAKTSSSKTSSSKKAASSSGTSVKLTATEKKVIELYRAADTETKKSVMNLLTGDDKNDSLVSSLLGGKGSNDIIGNLIGGMFGGKK